MIKEIMELQGVKNTGDINVDVNIDKLSAIILRKINQEYKNNILSSKDSKTNR